MFALASLMQSINNLTNSLSHFSGGTTKSLGGIPFW
jgi:hypothetical protein